VFLSLLCDKISIQKFSLKSYKVNNFGLGRLNFIGHKNSLNYAL